MSKKERAKIRAARTLRHLRPTRIVKRRQSQKVIESFAEKLGLVYFGYVDQRDDEHRLVRGFTVSQTQIDTNYCIGTVRGYDIVLVTRNDVVMTKKDHPTRCHWLMYTIDLHTKITVPHLYVGHRTERDVFTSKYSRLYPLSLGALGQYPHQFVSDYTVYGIATNAVLIERTIPPQLAAVIASHFRGASFEIEDNTIILSVENEHPTEAQLDKLLSNGLWLAESIDSLYAMYAQQAKAAHQYEQ